MSAAVVLILLVLRLLLLRLLAVFPAGPQPPAPDGFYVVVCLWMCLWLCVSGCVCDCVFVHVFVIVCLWLCFWSCVCDGVLWCLRSGREHRHPELGLRSGGGHTPTNTTTKTHCTTQPQAQHTSPQTKSRTTKLTTMAPWQHAPHNRMKTNDINVMVGTTRSRAIVGKGYFGQPPCE